MQLRTLSAVGISLLLSSTVMAEHVKSNESVEPLQYCGPTGIYGTDGNDAFCAPDEDCEQYEKLGYKIFRTTEGDDRICPGNGNDYINAVGGDDIVLLDITRDRLGHPGSKARGEGGFKTIYLGDGNDSVPWMGRNSGKAVGGCGSDNITGGLGNDTIYGYSDSGDLDCEYDPISDVDSLHGGLGNDHLIGAKGTSILYGDHVGDNICDGTDSALTVWDRHCRLCWGIPENSFMDDDRVRIDCDNLRGQAQYNIHGEVVTPKK